MSIAPILSFHAQCSDEVRRATARRGRPTCGSSRKLGDGSSPERVLDQVLAERPHCASAVVVDDHAPSLRPKRHSVLIQPRHSWRGQCANTLFAFFSSWY